MENNGDSMSIHALIQATALNRYYGDYQAVNNFNLTLVKGEVLGLLGPNGAGKSSTMQMLTGNISPSSGEVFINGVNLVEEPELAKKSIGYLPEQPPIYRDMTVVEFLNYCAALHRIPRPQRKSAVTEVLERCGLQDVPNKLIASLSKGFQQRVGIAQAILHKPDVVILDEPTVGLDPIQITQIRQLIRDLADDHAVILSTHILPEVQAVCDRVQIINQGKTVFSDTFEALSKRQTASEIVVSFSLGGDSAVLDTLKGVDEVEVLPMTDGHNKFRIKYKKQQCNGADVFQLAVKKGWVLNELCPQVETLEQIFMRLIHTDIVGISDEAGDE
jgi:ABC-2 type transport system ATP-binding protein